MAAHPEILSMITDGDLPDYSRDLIKAALSTNDVITFNELFAKHSNETVISVCELLQEGKSHDEIINKLNLKNNKKTKLFITMIKGRYKWNHISKEYVWESKKYKTNKVVIG